MTDGRVAAEAIPWRHRGRGHLTIVAKAVFAIVPDGVVAHRGPGSFGPWSGTPRGDRLGRGTDEAVHRARCDVTMVGRARPAPGTVDPFVRLGVADKGRIVLDKTVRVADVASLGAIEDASRLAALTASARAGLERDPVELADDFAWEFYQSAPRDQQIAFPVGGESLVLDGIDLLAPRLVTQLPPGAAEARVRVVRGGAVGLEAQVLLRCDAIAVDADRREVTLVWRGAWAVREGVVTEDCLVAAGLSASAQPVAWASLWSRSSGSASTSGPRASVDDSTLIQLPGAGAVPFTLPFASTPIVAAVPVAPVGSVVRPTPAASPLPHRLRLRRAWRQSTTRRSRGPTRC